MYILFRLKNKGVTTEKLLLPIEFDNGKLFDFVLEFYESYYEPFEVESRNIEDIVDKVKETAITGETKKGKYKDFSYKSEIVKILN